MKSKPGVSALSNNPSQKKFFKERTSPKAQSKPKKKSVSPHELVPVQMVDNFISNSNLFTGNAGGAPKPRSLANQLAAVNSGPRINHAAQQQYATNVVTT
jgi:hypothetical protein